MKHQATILFLAACVGVATITAAGCASSPAASGTTGKGGTGATTGAGGTQGNVSGIKLVPSATGWIDKTDVGNTIGVQGAWYAYGDAYGDKKCITAGHTAAECSVITMPDPTASGFPNTAGKMCTSGTAAKVLNGSNAMPDYSNMWGAGIGLDLNASGGDNSVKSPYNATMNGVTGIAFTIDTIPLGGGLRVEFPIPATEGGTAGSDYWGASTSYPPSPVAMGVNTITWDMVKSPAAAATAVAFDPTQILSIQFHVPSGTASATPYSFCISDLTFLK